MRLTMHSTIKRLLAAGFVCSLVSICQADTPPATAVDQSGFDKSVKPGDDFFTYVDGGWIAANPIPPQFGQWGIFVDLRQRNETQLREILDGLVKQKDLTEDERKLRDYWIAATDEAGLEKQGITPLADDLKQIATLQKPEDVPG